VEDADAAPISLWLTSDRRRPMNPTMPAYLCGFSTIGAWFVPNRDAGPTIPEIGLQALVCKGRCPVPPSGPNTPEAP
jgi:hypothetical protein